MNLKPQQIFLFIVITLSVLGLLMYVFPEKGIDLGSGLKLEFLTWNEFTTSTKRSTLNIDSIISGNEVNVDSLVFQEAALLDSAFIDSVKVFYNPIAIAVDSVRQYIEFPENKRFLLDSAFKSMAGLGSGNDLIRFLHYGDSQIESDRITAYLRYKLQQQFGGSGPGFLPILQAYEFFGPMSIIASKEWKRYSVFPSKDTLVQHKRYGILGSFYKFTPLEPEPEVDSSTVFSPSILKNTRQTTSSVVFAHTQSSFQNVKIFHKCKLYYGYNSEPFRVKIFADGQQVADDNLPSTSFMAIRSWTLAQSPMQNIKFEFEGGHGPEIYGIALDGMKGIAVDNIALRGCSGTIFTDMDAAMLQTMYNTLSVKLIILQFGGNTVPYLTPEKVDGFKKYFVAQLRMIRKLCPQISILVIGPADMSMKVKDTYETYEVLEPVRDALRQASFENNCAFWDMYAAMGGKNSMPGWVFAEKPLAEKDFIHFTPNGANIVAKMFYNAFITEYNRYLARR